MGLAGRRGNRCGVGMETLHLSRLEPALAAGLLAGMAGFDPAGRTTQKNIEAMTTSGQCFAATADKSQAVYVLHVDNGVAWVSACKGSGPAQWARLLLPVIEVQAKGCNAVSFQTKRRGLVREAQRQGYQIAGYIMKKDLQ